MAHENISAHITYGEATRTSVKLPNVPNPEQLERMKLTASQIFEPLRNHFGAPIRINSFFRSPAVNHAVGGAGTSQHLTGEAMDICAPANAAFTSADIFNFIKKELPFDQLIWEFGNSQNPDWVHVSYRKDRRKQVLKSVKQKGKTVYLSVS